MSPFADFLQHLFSEGRAVLAGPPAHDRREDAGAAAVLERFYAAHRLEVAGPLLAFDRSSALGAAWMLYNACWFLVSRDEPAEVLETALVLRAPASVEQHLSADLSLRLLCQVYGRARLRDPEDALCRLLARVLRDWPLSGVLSTVAEEPLTSVDFDGHTGLLLLYAERWCRKQKPAWLPRGRGLEYLELVWSDLGRDPAILRQAEQAHVSLAAGGGDQHE